MHTGRSERLILESHSISNFLSQHQMTVWHSRRFGQTENATLDTIYITLSMQMISEGSLTASSTVLLPPRVAVLAPRRPHRRTCVHAQRALQSHPRITSRIALWMLNHSHLETSRLSSSLRIPEHTYITSFTHMRCHPTPCWPCIISQC